MRLRRQVWVIAHRWAGLTLALFLTIAGITGTLLAFYDEIEPALTPHVHLVQPSTPHAELLDPHELRAKVQATYPGAIINYLPLHLEPGHSVKLDIRRIEAVSGKLEPWSNEVDEVFVDPYTGRITGQRLWGDITQGAINFMPFVYRLHYTLIAGTTGRYVLGIAALIWTLDTLIGFYLTLPRRRRREHSGIATSAQSWWSRWKPSWLVRWSGGQSKLTFDLHRAGGLWLWPMLFVFAWSGVTFNLDEVYDPVIKFFGRERLQDGLETLAQPRHDSQLSFAAAADRGRALAEKEVAQRGLVIDSHGASALQYRPAHGAYVYYFSTDRDFTVRGGRSMLVFDGDTGEIRKLLLPQGANGGHTFTEWIIALHMGRVWGLPYRIVVSVIGLMVTVLSITGVVIWMRKRQARSFANAKLTRRYDEDDSQALAPTMEPALRRE
jgi:uncharacterized iron-regulated membrane protein